MFSASNKERLDGLSEVYFTGMTPELDAALKAMIRTETETLELVNATNKLLECYGITRDLVSKEEFSRFYRALRRDNASDKELAFTELENFSPDACAAP